MKKGHKKNKKTNSKSDAQTSDIVMCNNEEKEKEQNEVDVDVDDDDSDDDDENENKNGVKNENKEDSVVTPWEVSGKIDYDRLIENFGTERIDDALIERIKKLTGRDAHPWLRRGIFFSHRNLTEILDAYERGEKFYLYTGRGPSKGMHLGHLIPFMFTRYLQEAFGVILVIQISDDEKFHFQKFSSDGKRIEMEKFRQMGLENMKDIIACGFDPRKTFIFSNYSFRTEAAYNELYNEMMSRINLSQFRGIFGFKYKNTIGQLTWPIYQAVPAFSSAFPKIFGENSNLRCLVPYAIDQDPYFRYARDVAPKLDKHKPCAIMSTFLPPLSGPGKMSSSGDAPTIYLTDTPAEIRKKIMSHAFSGGGATLEEHRKNGANLDVDVCYQWLRHFEDSDSILDLVGTQYKSGSMTTGEIKKITADRIVSLIEKHQKARNAVTPEILAAFSSVDNLDI